MGQALAMDLRSRVLAAIEGGMSCRQAAAHFGVSVSIAIRWRSLVRKQGDARPKPQGGDRRSGGIEAHAATILGLVEATPDNTLAEIRVALSAKGPAFGIGNLWRFLERRRITLKKDRARRRARPPRHSEAVARMVRGQARPRPGRLSSPIYAMATS